MSGKSTTIVVSSSYSRATVTAADTAEPAEPPMRMPSCRVTARAIKKASLSGTRTHRSTTLGSNVSGKKSSPIPSVRYGRGASPV